MPRLRRTFLAALVLTGTLGIAGACLWTDYLDSELRSEAERQGIVITSGKKVNRRISSEKYEGEPVNWLRRWHYLPILLGELDLYPKDALKRLGVNSINLVERLRCDGKFLGGVWLHDQQALLLNASSPRIYDEANTRAIHHEIFHAIDKWGQTRDRQWGASNSNGFEYEFGKQGADLLEEMWLKKGFIDAYSQISPGEDKAEIYAYMVIRPKMMARHAETDPILLKKMVLMKKRLASLNAGFDQAFWDKVNSRPGGQSESRPAHFEEAWRFEPPNPGYEPVGAARGNVYGRE